MSEGVTQSRTKKGSVKKDVVLGNAKEGKSVSGTRTMRVKRAGERSELTVRSGAKDYTIAIWVNKETARYVGVHENPFDLVPNDLVVVGPIGHVIYQKFVKRNSLSPKEQQKLFHIGSATLARRKREKADLTKTESDHFFRVAEVYRSAEEIFGSHEKANRWLGQRSPVLGDQRPKDLLDSSAGVDAVKDELLRIAYGVYA